MKVYSDQVTIAKDKLNLNEIKRIFSSTPNKTPIRFLISRSTETNFVCEIDYVSEISDYRNSGESIFDFSIREFENTSQFNAVLLIPTGIGAEIGGHCGDANVVSRLIASACDTLITHPNVVNASDINEMTENTLYVEGSIISRMLMGRIGLQRVRANRILMLMDSHKERAFNNAIVNLISTARISLGIDCDVIEMKDIISATSLYTQSGRAAGEITHLEKLFEVIKKYRNDYDAVGLATFVNVPVEHIEEYFTQSNVINPWGGIEAMLTHSIAWSFDLPCAHAPIAPSLEIVNTNFEKLGIVDPRKASESFSRTFLYSCIKGLHKSPRIVYRNGLTVDDISCLIIPNGCVGLPTLAAIEQGIPIIAVRENKNLMANNLEDLPIKKGKLYIVDNYLEAVGVMTAIKAGITPSTVRRPLAYTNVL